MLSPQEKRCLRDELAKSAGVYLAQLTGNAAAIRRGRRMAKTIQAELAAASMDSLNETMTRLRGQAAAPAPCAEPVRGSPPRPIVV